MGLTTNPDQDGSAGQDYPDGIMNGPVDHATGLEKYELLMEEKGIDDPFFCKMGKRGEGSKDNPNIIKAMSDYRMVGCVCNEDDTNIKFMWLYEGKPKRCKCGYWFKLDRVPAPLKSEMPL